MLEPTTVGVSKILEELEQAIQRYRTIEQTDTDGTELLPLWQRIRELSLQVSGFDNIGDGVAAEHSY
jgi:hypothetical protein